MATLTDLQNLGNKLVSNAYADPALTSFKKTNLFYTNNPLLKYQDPTYLGFKLFFKFDQPDSGLLNSNPKYTNTALGYLNAIGDTQRATYLLRFIELLKGINSQCPWFWQSITGLDDAWKHGFGPEFKPGYTEEKKISINTLDESIDFRMTALIDLYRKACFDWMHKREVVPRNLRRFSISVYCYEARNLNRSGDPGNPLRQQTIFDALPAIRSLKLANQQAMQTLLGIDPTVGDPETGNDYINDNISRVMFDFGLCEFLPDESGVIFSELSNGQLANKAQRISFSYQTVGEDNLYNMFSETSVTDLFLTTLDALSIGSPISTSGNAIDVNGPLNQTMSGVLNSLLTGLEETALSVATQYVNPLAKIQSLFLGNVYGFSPSTLATSFVSDPAAVPGEILQDVGKNQSLHNRDKESSGNVYDR